MFRKGSIFSILLDAAIFIALEVAALTMLNNNGQLQNLWISKFAHNIMATVWGSSQQISGYFHLATENDELAQENFRLRQQLFIYQDLYGHLTTSQYKNDGIAGNFRFVPAEIVKISKNGQHNYIILDKGSRHGIVPNSGIVTEKGVIGIIESVSENYSYAMSFTNANLSISSRIGKEGIVGPLSWDGISSRGAILKEIPLHIEVQPSDTIFTSGHSSFFPAGIPLGKVRDSKIVNGSTMELSIDLFQDFNSLRYVTIVNNIHDDELKLWEETE